MREVVNGNTYSTLAGLGAFRNGTFLGTLMLSPPGVALASGFVAPCIPTRALKPPAGPGWVHEIKHDGYRLQVRRVGDQVRLFTRRG